MFQYLPKHAMCVPFRPVSLTFRDNSSNVQSYAHKDVHSSNGRESENTAHA